MISGGTDAVGPDPIDRRNAASGDVVRQNRSLAGRRKHVIQPGESDAGTCAFRVDPLCRTLTVADLTIISGLELVCGHKSGQGTKNGMFQQALCCGPECGHLIIGGGRLHFCRRSAIRQ